MAHGDRYTSWEDDFILDNIEKGTMGYKAIATQIHRTRDSVRSRYRELIGEGRESRRDSRAIGGKGYKRGWYAR